MHKGKQCNKISKQQDTPEDSRESYSFVGLGIVWILLIPIPILFDS